MSLYVVPRDCTEWRAGTYIECFSHGCSVVQVRSRDNRLEVVREIGLTFPQSLLKGKAVKILGRGFDRRAM